MTDPLLPIASTFLATLVLLTSAAVAQDEGVRWKFAVGDRFAAVQKQSTVINTRVDKRATRIDSSVRLEMLWEVTDVADDQTATILQTVKAIEVNVDDPANAAKSVEVDTTSDTRPPRKARELDKQLELLTGSQFVIRMTSQGEVVRLKIPESTVEKFEGIADDSLLKKFLDPVKLQNQIAALTVVLPNELLESMPEKRTSWTLEAQSASDQSGVVDVGQRVLTYVGSKTIGGESLAQFELSLAKEFGAASTGLDQTSAGSASSKLTDLNWSGDLLFDPRAGHCSRCDQRTRLVTEAKHGEMKISTELEINSTFQLQRTALP